jgi:hypothetical protein
MLRSRFRHPPSLILPTRTSNMITKNNSILRFIMILGCSLALPASGWAWGQQFDWNGNGFGSPTPTPSPMPTVPPPDPNSSDNRYITVALEVSPPTYSNLNFIATGCSLNALVHFDAKLTTFRGYYEGSTRNPLSSATPPTSQPVTDPVRLTQAPPPPTPTPAPTAPPGQNYYDYYDPPTTARDFARQGNRRRHHRGYN